MAESMRHYRGSCPGVYGTLMSVPFLFVTVLGAAYIHLIPLEIGLHTLLTILFIFIVFLFFIPHNASYAACRISRNIALMEHDLQEGLKRNALTIMGKTKSTLSVRDFLEEYFKAVRDDNYAKVAASIFPMLGILGTFLAIAISMPDFTVNSSEKLDEQISILLAGIGTAFYASIYGIFLSLWWIFFERRGLASIERHVQALEELYNDKIWKKSELVKHEHMQSELKDQKILRILQETFNLDFIKEMSTQYLRNYHSIVNDMSQNFSVIADKMQESSRELRKTLERMELHRQSIQAEELMERNLRQFIKVAKSLEEGLERFDGSVERSLEKIDYELASAVERLGRMTEMIAKEQERLLRLSRRVSKESKSAELFEDE